MKITGKFVLNQRGVRHEILLSEGEPRVEAALVALADRVKPSGTEIFVSRTYGRQGRVVVHIFDRSANDAMTRRGRTTQRRWKKQALQQALARIDGRFMRKQAREIK